jgi:membrane protein
MRAPEADLAMNLWRPRRVTIRETEFNPDAIMLATAWSLLRQTVSEWSEDGAPRLGAALAYYSVFSIGPLLLIAIGIASVLFDSARVENQVIGQVSSLVGDKGAEAVRAMIANASVGNQSLLGTLLGVGLLMFGAIAVVVQLKDALNIIWDVEEPETDGIWGYVRKYVISLAAVLGFGFLLTVSLLTTTFITAAASLLGTGMPPAVLGAINFVIDFGVLTLLFAMMFKWLPDIEIAWRDVWTGALLTSVLFIIGKFLIALYLGRQGIASTFGAASSIVLILVWIYYSAQLVFFGAEFTQVYARSHGSLAGVAHGHRGTSGKKTAPAPSGSVMSHGHVPNSLPYIMLIATAGAVGLAVGTLGGRIRSAYDDAEA